MIIIASCEHSRLSRHDTPLTATAYESKGNDHASTLTEGESSLDVLKFFTNHIMIEQILVEPSLNLSLSQDDLFAIPYDKNDLYADTCVISMPQLMNAHAICVLQPNTCG